MTTTDDNGFWRAEREGTIMDLRTERDRYSGISEGDIFARVILDAAILAVRRGQVARAGACGKPMEECGGTCSLPPGHADPCSCDPSGEPCPA